ncbi:hypothetical protein NLJ89_g10234 [Agrocybe chaxingu]|uniref:Uncharacterized protein n=1 Tax=Agrocybe chaxingu TaxID=84603 RepID=A0A9W8JRP0_9AGAR|nr:hypothetical protein NLJ89_g10234 [Agrocybe chaxingu]
MSAQQTTDNTHVMCSGSIIDPTIDKNPEHWTAERDPPPDIGVVSFNNETIGFYGYDPPKGFSPEEILQFRGASDCLTFEEITELINERNEKGTLELTGDDRFK